MLLSCLLSVLFVAVVLCCESVNSRSSGLLFKSFHRMAALSLKEFVQICRLPEDVSFRRRKEHGYSLMQSKDFESFKFIVAERCSTFSPKNPRFEKLFACAFEGSHRFQNLAHLKVDIWQRVRIHRFWSLLSAIVLKGEGIFEREKLIGHLCLELYYMFKEQCKYLLAQEGRFMAHSILGEFDGDQHLQELVLDASEDAGQFMRIFHEASMHLQNAVQRSGNPAMLLLLRGALRPAFGNVERIVEIVSMLLEYLPENAESLLLSANEWECFSYALFMRQGIPLNKKSLAHRPESLDVLVEELNCQFEKSFGKDLTLVQEKMEHLFQQVYYVLPSEHLLTEKRHLEKHQKTERELRDLIPILIALRAGMYERVSADDWKKLLQQFGKLEMLDEHNGWFCSKDEVVRVKIFIPEMEMIMSAVLEAASGQNSFGRPTFYQSVVDAGAEYVMVSE